MTVPILIDVGASVTIRAILMALADLLAWLAVLLIAAIIVALVEIILWPLNKAISSLTGGIIGSVPGSHALANAAVGFLHSAVNNLDAAAGDFWHGIRKLWHQVGQEILGLAILAGYLAWYVSPFHLAQIIGKQIGHLVKSVGNASKLAHQAERVAHRAESKVGSLARSVGREFGVVEHAIDVTLPKEIANARDLAKEAEDLANRAWDSVKGKPWVIGAAAFASLVLAALNSLGLGWLKCPSNPFNKSKTPCALWTDLADLLGLAVAILAAEDFDKLVHEMQGLEEDVIGAAKDLFNLG